MVQSDVEFIQDTADTMRGRIDWIKEHVEFLKNASIFEAPIAIEDIKPENFAGQWENLAYEPHE
jgi:hypothetical protein